MATLKLETVSTFEVIACAECAIQFAIPARLDAERRRDHKNFWCPHGHPQHFPAETEEERLKKELDRAQRATAEWRDAYSDQYKAREAEKKAHAATKGTLTKTRKRIANGVCPDCNRTFVNVQRHMSTQHPGHAS